MNQTDRFAAARREALRLAFGAAVLPLFGARQVLASDILAKRIAPPASEMIYRRIVERELHGGAMFRVTRDFAVRFESLGRGFQVRGQQVQAYVEAPANLAQLATLEEQRVELGIFPLTLDGAGLIVDGSDDVPNEQISAAVAEVQRRLGGDAAEAGTLVEALHSAGLQLTAELPRDLFSPPEGLREERAQIALPWGESGEVETKFEASCDPQTMLMRTASRQVITRLGSDERRSAERWELFSA
jgi:hypothetical protein